MGEALCRGVREAGQGSVMGCAQWALMPASWAGTRNPKPQMRSRQKAEGRAWNPRENVLEIAPTLSTHPASDSQREDLRAAGRAGAWAPVWAGAVLIFAVLQRLLQMKGSGTCL